MALQHEDPVPLELLVDGTVHTVDVEFPSFIPVSVALVVDVTAGGRTRSLPIVGWARVRGHASFAMPMITCQLWMPVVVHRGRLGVLHVDQVEYCGGLVHVHHLEQLGEAA